MECPKRTCLFPPRVTVHAAFGKTSAQRTAFRFNQHIRASIFLIENQDLQKTIPVLSVPLARTEESCASRYAILKLLLLGRGPPSVVNSRTLRLLTNVNVKDPGFPAENPERGAVGFWVDGLGFGDLACTFPTH